MSENLLSEIVVLIGFLILVFILFDDKKDYLIYSLIVVVVSGLISAINIPEARNLENYIEAIHWDVIFFLICMFAIVEILKKALVFHYIAKKIVNKFESNIRTMFWMICLVSTLSAAIIEDLSVALIFIPIIIETCRDMEISPKPFLLGMTICINLASTLTPFGSAENVMIASYYDLTLNFFLKYLFLYFALTTFLTLFILDKVVLKKEMLVKWTEYCEDETIAQDRILLEDIDPDPKVLKRNFVGLAVFVVLLLVISHLFLAGLIGLIIFVILNPTKDKNGKPRPNVSKVFERVDYKLVFFFMCLFILVYLMELNGFIVLIEGWIENLSIDNVFGLSVVILLVTSILSGFMDNAPVTVLFLPIIELFTNRHPGFQIPFLIAMILGVNLGGNFLPQGSAADMMTLELSEKFCVRGMSYKNLVKWGGLFALFHAVIGIGYLALVIYIFPI